MSLRAAWSDTKSSGRAASGGSPTAISRADRLRRQDR